MKREDDDMVLRKPAPLPDALFEYRGAIYPDYLRRGNGSQHILATAAHFCRGVGFDVGGGRWPFPGAEVVDFANGGDAMKLPEQIVDYVFSSHCLEHLPNYVAALEHWKSRIRTGGALFLYLPHADMEYWRPENCRKHLHEFRPETIARALHEIGFRNIIRSERDLAWSFSVVGWV